MLKCQRSCATQLTLCQDKRKRRPLSTRDQGLSGRLLQLQVSQLVGERRDDKRRGWLAERRALLTHESHDLIQLGRNLEVLLTPAWRLAQEAHHNFTVHLLGTTILADPSNHLLPCLQSHLPSRVGQLSVVLGWDDLRCLGCGVFGSESVLYRICWRRGQSLGRAAGPGCCCCRLGRRCCWSRSCSLRHRSGSRGGSALWRSGFPGRRGS